MRREPTVWHSLMLDSIRFPVDRHTYFRFELRFVWDSYVDQPHYCRPRTWIKRRAEASQRYSCFFFVMTAAKVTISCAE